MMEFDIKALAIVILCIVLAIVCIALGYTTQEIEIIRNQCGVIL